MRFRALVGPFGREWRFLDCFFVRAPCVSIVTIYIIVCCYCVTNHVDRRPLNHFSIGPFEKNAENFLGVTAERGRLREEEAAKVTLFE